MEDAPRVHQLIQQSPPLDLNSCYCYTLLCDHFAETCVVAEAGDRILGFCSAYHPPAKPGTLFVWQVVVHADARGQGLAKRLILHLLERPACARTTHIEATVAPSNSPSRALFESIARHLNTSLSTGAGYPRPALSLDNSHEAEPLVTIGPFRAVTKQ